MDIPISEFRKFGKKIICVGRNYRALAAEQGRPIPENPILFLKPTSSYIGPGDAIEVPQGCDLFYHEVELGVVIGSLVAKQLDERDAMDCVAGYALCLDMTAMDFQLQAKANGWPWTLAKGFNTACPVSAFIPKEKIPNTSQTRLWLKVDGQMKQDSSTSDMIFTVTQIITYLSRYFTLEPGDLVLTGSPAGAGPVTRGQTIEAGIEVQGKTLIKDFTFPVK